MVISAGVPRRVRKSREEVLADFLFPQKGHRTRRHDVKTVEELAADRERREAFARAIAAYSEEGHAAVLSATEKAHYAPPSLLVLLSIAVEHGSMRQANVPVGFVL
jgi:hypothetical protein